MTAVGGIPFADLPSQDEIGRRMYDVVAALRPIPRSLTGDGVRETFARIAERVPLAVSEVPSGTPLYDWTAPDEWNLRAARITGPDGAVVVDAADSPLHVVGYSVPVDERMPLARLQEHLHSLPDQPDLVPYRTSYWQRTWGFCLADSARRALPEGEYRVLIDAELGAGHMTYAEAVVGDGPQEILLSTPSCHPEMCNDNLSGVGLLVTLAEVLAQAGPLRHTYRFLFSPGTVGALAWLSRNEDRLDRVRAGLAVMCVGDRGPMVYKRTRHGDAGIDRAAVRALADMGVPHSVEPFVPWGGDERQFSTPGFDLPVGVLSRTPPGRFPENHTSADDLSYVSAEAMGEVAMAYLRIIDILEGDAAYINLRPKGEPQLGRRGLSRRMGGEKGGSWELALLWVLSLSDGATGLLDIADRSGLPFAEIRDAASALLGTDLLAPADAAGRR